MQTNCCRKCCKIFCENRNEIEDCQQCISYVLQSFREIDKKLNIKEEIND